MQEDKKLTLKIDGTTYTYDPDKLNFGNVLKGIRIDRQWTLEEMAKHLGTTKQAISKYERGERTPKITIAAKFADALDIPLESLVGKEITITMPETHKAKLQSVPKTQEARIISGGIDKMPKERREQALKILQVAFAEYADLFKEVEDDNT